MARKPPNIRSVAREFVRKTEPTRRNAMAEYKTPAIVSRIGQPKLSVQA
jgi:hypothetical protein